MAHTRDHLRCPKCGVKRRVEADERPYCPCCDTYFDAEGNVPDEAPLDVLLDDSDHAPG